MAVSESKAAISSATAWYRRSCCSTWARAASISDSSRSSSYTSIKSISDSHALSPVTFSQRGEATKWMASSVSNRAELSEILTAAPEGLLALPLDAKLASFRASLLVPQGNIFDEFVERPVRRRSPRSGFVCLLCHAALLVAP
jgi:hypothetical protein